MLHSANLVWETLLYLSFGMLLPSNNKNPDSTWQTIRKMYYHCNRKSWFMMGVWLGWFIGTAIWSTISVVFLSDLCHHKHLLLSGWVQNFQPSNPERITQGNKEIIHSFILSLRNRKIPRTHWPKYPFSHASLVRFFTS